MNQFLTTATSEEQYHEIVNNFLLWLKRQPYMRQQMNRDKVSTLVFQLGYTLVDGNDGEKFLFPTKTAVQHEKDYPAYWEQWQKKQKKK